MAHKEQVSSSMSWVELLGYTPSSETQSAIDAILLAGEAIRASRGRGTVEQKAGTHNVVTEGDRASGERILAVLKERYAHDSFLTEETSYADSLKDVSMWLSKDRLWVIDELDGSSNNKDGISDVYVSIAHAEKGIVKTGVAYNPYTDELYVAQADQEAAYYIRTEEGKRVKSRLAVSPRTELKGSSFETSMSYDDEQSADHNILRLAMNVAGVSGRPREIGTSVGQLCRVARGQSDFHFHKGLKPWDLAAGMLLIQKAGGIFVGMDGSDITFMSPHSVSGNEPVVREFVSFNRKLAEDRTFKTFINTRVSDIIERYNAT